ncbi:MAG: putative type modification enzyme [Verrucomicrobiales bacterium]|nr:putative type modification enzyme [Verrucomicrobiales bacterium]
MALESKPLFHPEVIRQQVRSFNLPERVAELQPMLQRWADLISSGKADNLKETTLLPDFLTDIFCNLLGYTLPVGSDTFTLSRETHVDAGGKVADAVLGRFNKDRKECIVALEGKGTRDPLDRPFAGRPMSAVDQAYRYAINLQCDWIIVTSMRETRLYYKGANQHSYERFDTVRLAADPALLKRFVFLLGAERIVPEKRDCHLKELLKASESVGRKLTNEFYALYADIRQKVLTRLCRENPATPPPEILRCTQKLLDRVLFCAFCEDRGLLPEESLKRAFAHSDPYNPKPIWENFRCLFRAVDTGNAGLKITAYNGGLFAVDPGLDCLAVPDDVCAHFKDLGDYDYRPAREVADADETTEVRSLIDVDILGHIFEQSITDLERLRQTLETSGVPVDEGEATTRRKKEGAFYTPAFITRYNVEQALGAVVKTRFETLRQKHETEATGTARKALTDPNAYDLNALKEPQRKALIRFWEAWQEELKSLRILDPACGSGAFLIEAFDQLHAFYEISNARLEELRGERTLFDLDRQILQHNLYGVDLNAEAIQICQLSLWIKTAARGKQLTSLDHTIREGNSVVNDLAAHPKAFNWQASFPEVFAQGGFDVVVGNPPYLRQEWLAPFKPYWEKRYQSYHGVADIFVYFFEQGIEVLRSGGRLAFITSGSWVRGNFGAPLRKFLSANAKMESMVDFGEFQPFEDAEMIRPSITIVAKDKPGGEMRLFKWLTAGPPPETLSEEIAISPTVQSDRFGEASWELESDGALKLRTKLSAKHPTLQCFTSGQILYGIKTGLNEVFIIGKEQRDSLIAEDASSADIIRPFRQGSNIRPWYVEDVTEYLIFTRRGIRIEDYPAVHHYLARFRTQLEPKPADWDGTKKWPGRKEGSYRWFEIQDTVDYWKGFEQPKLVWPDITNRPRFCIDRSHCLIGDTSFAIPGGDDFLLGILASWATWFFISKTAQPLRLRSDRWQYRLKAQYMEHIPIPNASEAERQAIAELARTCSSVGLERYQGQVNFQRRLLQTFSIEGARQLNQKAEAWWELSLNQLGDALKQSFKLPANPMKSPRAADEWEPYLQQKRDENARLTRALNDAEAELNDRVYRLFDLTAEEIKLLQKEVEH